MVCKNCNKENVDGLKYCFYCGHKFEVDNEAAKDEPIIDNPLLLTIPINQHKIRLHICIHRRKIKFIFNEIDKSEFYNEVKYHLGGSYL